MMKEQFWRGKRVLVTGHTGFQGSWLSLWLKELGAEVSGLSLAPQTEPSLFALLGGAADGPGILDIRDRDAVLNHILRTKPQIVFHLAAQALARSGYRNPAETYDVNVLGTSNLLNALRIAEDIRSIVVVTTDGVYRNPDAGLAFMETDPLGGQGPLEASKAAAEIVAASYRASFFAARRVGLATARAGNVIGGGDWSEDSVFPDAVRTWQAGGTLHVPNPRTVRPWQHVLEPLGGYVGLAQRLWHAPEGVESYNFGPDHGEAASIGAVLKMAERDYGGGRIAFGDGQDATAQAGYLVLDSSRARTELGYQPRWRLRETVRRTMHWYRALNAGEAARDLCLADLRDFVTAGRDGGTVRQSVVLRAVG